MPLISDSIGRVLGKRYRLLSALGTGASAHVYLAEDVSLQRHVAVKVLQPGLATDEAFLKRFRAEARSVASLNHPHVLRVFDWGEDTDGPYLVLEYLGGGRCATSWTGACGCRTRRRRSWGPRWRRAWRMRTLRGLVHRDIKPANLLFDEEGRVRVADFGVARALAEAAWTEPAGAMVGTARYISPEAAEGKPVEGQADVYSLALVLYEAVTGTVPFVTDTTMGTLAARIGQPLPHDALGAAGRRAGAGGRARRHGAPGRGRAGGAARRAGRRVADAGAAAARVRAPGAIRAHRRLPRAGRVRADGLGVTAVRPAAMLGDGGGAPLAGAGRDQGRARGRSSTPSRTAARRRRAAGGGAGAAAAAVVRAAARRGHRGGGGAAVLLAAGLAVAFGTNVLHGVAPDAGADQPDRWPRRGRTLAKVHMDLAGPAGEVDHGGRGDIVSQTPKAGVSQKEGSTVTVVVVRRAARRDRAVAGRHDVRPGGDGAAGGALQVGCAPGAYNNNIRPACSTCGRSARRRTRPRRPTAPRSPWCPRSATSRRPCPHPDQLHLRPGARPRCRRWG